MSEPDEAAPPRARTGMSIGVMVIATIGLAIPTVMIAVAFKSCLGTTTRGSVAVHGAGLDWRSSLGTCTADPATLSVALGPDDAPAVVHVLLDPLDGGRLDIVTPASPVPLVLTKASCPSLRVDVHRTGQRSDGSQVLDGSVSASCRTVDGVQIELDAWWRACHQPDEDP